MTNITYMYWQQTRERVQSYCPPVKGLRNAANPCAANAGRRGSSNPLKCRVGNDDQVRHWVSVMTASVQQTGRVVLILQSLVLTGGD